MSILKEKEGARFNSIGGPTSSVPFDTMFTGIVLLNLFYWCTNQQIIQRTFGAKSLAEGQKGVFLTGLLKLLGPLYLVLPGMIAYALFAGDESVEADTAYGTLVNSVLPAPLTGFFAAVMAGAILSSFNSALNSTTTLFSLGIYKDRINKDASDESVVRAGKRFGWIIAIVSMIIAPLLAGQDSIFGYLQKMNGIYFIPIFSVVLVGLLARRVPAVAAKTALLGGLALICFGYFVPLFSRTGVDGSIERISFSDKVHEYHFLGMSFAFLVILQLVIGMVKPLAEPWTQTHSGDVDVTPWKYTPLAAGGLVLLVFLIYAAFADFSVLGG
jgi:SSS family solute:Na+ symporter